MVSSINTFQGMPQAQQNLVASYLTASEANAIGMTCKENMPLKVKSPDFVEAQKSVKVFLECRNEIASDVRNYDEKMRCYKRIILENFLLTAVCVSLMISPFVGIGLLFAGVLVKVAVIVMPILMAAFATGFVGISLKYQEHVQPEFSSVFNDKLSKLNNMKIPQNKKFQQLFQARIPLTENHELLKMLRAWEAEKAAKKKAEQISLNTINAEQVD